VYLITQQIRRLFIAIGVSLNPLNGDGFNQVSVQSCKSVQLKYSHVE
jgi:hypothetical protein